MISGTGGHSGFLVRNKHLSWCLSEVRNHQFHMILDEIGMEEVEKLPGNDSVEDVNWLCSLSESELNMLISLKIMVLQRAKIIGHDDLAKKFDLKTLRAIGTILMEYFEGQLRNKSSNTDLAEFDELINNSSLLKLNSGSFMSLEELKASIGCSERKIEGKVASIKASQGKIAAIEEDVEA